MCLDGIVLQIYTLVLVAQVVLCSQIAAAAYLRSMLSFSLSLSCSVRKRYLLPIFGATHMRRNALVVVAPSILVDNPALAPASPFKMSLVCFQTRSVSLYDISISHRSTQSGP